MPSSRNSRIEVLRIVAMVAIVAHHYVVHGDVRADTGSANTAIFLAAMASYGKWGVDLFVLVSAFFMDRRPHRGKQLSSVYSQVIPASWLILVAVTVGGMSLGGFDLRKSLAPVLFGQYWFVTTFVLLILIAPYLSLLADHLSRVQHLRLLAGGAIAWSLLNLVDGVALGFSNLAWFVLLYLVAAYVRRYPIAGSAKAWGIAALVLTVSIATVTVAIDAVLLAAGRDPGSVGWVMDTYAGAASPLALTATTAVLVWAIKALAWNSRVINYWAGAAFGVYLIHDNPLIRRVIWTDWFDTTSASGQWWLPLHAAGAVIVVYLACSLIIFALQPTAFKAAHQVTESVRVRIEARLNSANA